MKLLLIRHGQSANNAGPDHLRVPDPGLTAVGHEQSKLLAERLSAQPISQLYCSPFLRALETIRPLAETMGKRVNVRADIFEKGRLLQRT